jgi:dolichol-phosphate mannosyltransferase
VEGWTSLICVVLITAGVQLLMLGTMGEYLWRCLDQSRPRPRFIIESIDGKAP